MVTESGSLFTVLSFTINCATYVPETSTVKDGFIAVKSERAALLPGGTEVNDHWKVNVSPSTSLLPLPSRATVSPAYADWSGPALATGGLLVLMLIVVVQIPSNVPIKIPRSISKFGETNTLAVLAVDDKPVVFNSDQMLPPF